VVLDDQQCLSLDGVRGILMTSRCWRGLALSCLTASIDAQDVTSRRSRFAWWSTFGWEAVVQWSQVVEALEGGTTHIRCNNTLQPHPHFALASQLSA